MKKYLLFIGLTYLLCMHAKAQLNFKLFVVPGAHYVEQGKKLWIAVEADTIGYASNDTVALEPATLTTSNLPPASTAIWIDLKNRGYWQNPDSTWFTLMPFQTGLEIATSGSTPVGTYSITIIATTRKNNTVHQTNYTIIVEPPSHEVPTPMPFCKRPPLPDSALFVNNMITFGQYSCDGCVNYYDGEYVFYQIADYLHDTASWYPCSRNMRDGYRSLMLQVQGGTQGYNVFPDGLYEDYIRTKDTTSIFALKLLNGIHSGYGNAAINIICQKAFVRETSYQMRVMMDQIKFGIPNLRPRLDNYKDGELEDLDIFFRSKDMDYFESFMAGISAESLIRYYENINPDPKIFRYIKLAMDSLWTYKDVYGNRMWVEKDSAFEYADRIYTEGTTGGDTSVTANLNMLIAPAYAWLYHMTGDTNYRVKGDKMFAGGAKYTVYNYAHCTGWSEKIFNQNYRWGIKYITYRNMDPLVNCSPIPLSISENQAEPKFKLFPNPANNELNISYELSSSQNVLIELFDVKGEKVKTLYDQRDISGSHDFKADVSYLAKGFYVINMNGKREKLIVQ